MIRDFFWNIRYITLCVALLSSCIENDIPYPIVELEITWVEGDGFSQKSIDTKSRNVVIELEEPTDIRAVNITEVMYTEGATLSNDIIGVFDMRSALSTTLSLYQSYDWTIEAEQTITREFKVVGQIGEERIDTTNCIVEVDVNSESVDLSNVTVTAMKLGPYDVTTYSPTLSNLTNTSFTSVRRVIVTAHDRSSTWSIYIYAIDPEVSLSVETWGTVAWLTASGDTTDPDLCSFSYRKIGDTSWSDIAATSASNGVFSVQVTNLSPDTEYEFMAYVGDVGSAEISEKTETTPILENGGFEGWHQDGNPWYPFAIGEEEYWGTGNKGASLLSASSNITLPDSENIAPNSTGIYSAYLRSSSVMGIFAAGNIFTGTFVQIAGLNGIIGFGRPFTQRPLALRGWAKYNQGVITHTKLDNIAEGDNDMGSIYIALGTWDAATYGYDSTGELLGNATTPVIIDTRDASTFFDATGPDVIAYGELILNSNQDWNEFEIELEYNDINTVPTHIIIVCSSSRYGDYFTGSTSSEMWIDDFELIYE